LIVALEESKDLDTMKIEELGAILEAHKLWITDRNKEKAKGSALDQVLQAHYAKKRKYKKGNNYLMNQVLKNSEGSSNSQERWSKACIIDVLYVPNMKSNLISICQLLQKGYTMKRQAQTMRGFSCKDRLILKASLSKQRTFKI